MVARAIHHHGQRSGRPFVVVNCGAIPENLVESDLFGYERGAFTGADRQKRGKFEAADAGIPGRNRRAFASELNQAAAATRLHNPRVAATDEALPLLD